MVSDQTHDGDGAGGHKSSSTAPAAAPPPAASAVLPLERFGAPDFSPDACVTEMRRHVRAICVHSTCMPGAVLPVLLVSTCHTPPFAATHPRTGTAANSEAGAAKASDTAQGQGTHRTLSCCSVVIDHCDTRASSLHQRPAPTHHTCTSTTTCSTPCSYTTAHHAPALHSLTRCLQLVDAINEDHGEFVALGSRLASIEGAVTRMRQPLLEIQVCYNMLL